MSALLEKDSELLKLLHQRNFAAEKGERIYGKWVQGLAEDGGWCEATADFVFKACVHREIY